jgi:hypothetical protein
MRGFEEPLLKSKPLLQVTLGCKSAFPLRGSPVSSHIYVSSVFTRT